MNTVRRNAKKQLAAYASRVESVQSYSLGNGFKGVNCLEGVLNKYGSVLDMFNQEFVNDNMRYTRLTVNDEKNALCLHIHSNLWYNIKLK